MLDRSSPVPLYFQLRNLLLEEIESGAFKPGDAVPAERELIERYNVSRATVREAVSSLTAAGVLHRRHGLGTFVRGKRMEQELSRLTGLFEEMVARGLEPEVNLISAEMVKPDAVVAAKLRLSARERTLHVVRVWFVDGEPLCLGVDHFPEQFGEKLLKENLETALYGILERKLGVALRWADQVIQASPADESAARYLAIGKGTPILVMERVNYSVDDHPLNLSITSFRADRYTYRVRLTRDSGADSGIGVEYAQRQL